MGGGQASKKHLAPQIQRFALSCECSCEAAVQHLKREIPYYVQNNFIFTRRDRHASLAMTINKKDRDGLISCNLAMIKWTCHCEERNDEAIPFTCIIHKSLPQYR